MLWIRASEPWFGGFSFGTSGVLRSLEFASGASASHFTFKFWLARSFISKSISRRFCLDKCVSVCYSMKFSKITCLVNKEYVWSTVWLFKIHPAPSWIIRVSLRGIVEHILFLFVRSTRNKRILVRLTNMFRRLVVVLVGGVGAVLMSFFVTEGTECLPLAILPFVPKALAIFTNGAFTVSSSRVKSRSTSLLTNRFTLRRFVRRHALVLTFNYKWIILRWGNILLIEYLTIFKERGNRWIN